MKALVTLLMALMLILCFTSFSAAHHAAGTAAIIAVNTVGLEAPNTLDEVFKITCNICTDMMILMVLEADGGKYENNMIGSDGLVITTDKTEGGAGVYAFV